MKLLLDENISERLLPRLQGIFPGSVHARLVMLGGAADETPWDYAAEHGFLIVTKDEDFLSLSVRRGFSPKVICLAIGNVSNAITADCLLRHSKQIALFVGHPEAGFLLVGLSPPEPEDQLNGEGCTPAQKVAPSDLGSLLHLRFRMALHLSANAFAMATATATHTPSRTANRPASHQPAPPSRRSSGRFRCRHGPMPPLIPDQEQVVHNVRLTKLRQPLLDPNWIQRKAFR